MILNLIYYYYHVFFREIISFFYESHNYTKIHGNKEPNINNVPQFTIFRGKDLRKLSGNAPIFKGVNNNLKQFGLQYYIGKITKMHFPFLFDPYSTTCGLFFSDNNSHWYKNYDRLFKVSVPDDTLVVRFDNRCKSMELILETEMTNIDIMIEHGIYNRNILKKFGNLDKCSFDNIICYILNGYIYVYDLPNSQISLNLYVSLMRKGYYKLDKVNCIRTALSEIPNNILISEAFINAFKDTYPTTSLQNLGNFQNHKDICIHINNMTKIETHNI